MVERARQIEWVIDQIVEVLRRRAELSVNERVPPDHSHGPQNHISLAETDVVLVEARVDHHGAEGLLREMPSDGKKHHMIEQPHQLHPEIGSAAEARAEPQPPEDSVESADERSSI